MTDDNTFEIASSSPSFRTELAGTLAELVPEAVADGKVDVAKLQELLAVDFADDNERFGLFWPGKKRALRAAQEPTTATLRPALEDSKDWNTTGNVFIEGDNLEVLKILQRHYHGKVKAIYIDPPYNTGGDFIYPDNFKEGFQSYLEFTSQLDGEGHRLSSNTEADGRFHSNWLNMMYPRLKLARNLLADDGVLFASIDEHEVHHFRKMLDEVFGEACFVAQLTTLCNPKGRSQDKYFATNHEYVLVYARTVLDTGAFAVLKDSDQIDKEYPLDDGNGQYRLLELRNTHREFGRHNRKNLYYPVFASADGKVYLENGTGRTQVLPIWDDGFEGCWSWGSDKARRELSDLVARPVGNQLKVYRKAYAAGAKRMLKTILSDPRYYTEFGQRAFNALFGAKGKLFQSPKSPELIADLVATVTDGDDLVLDFFAGSGTTAHAIMQLNARDGGSRRIIQVQLPEPTPKDSEARKAGFKTIFDLARERVNRAGDAILADAATDVNDKGQSLDVGYRTYKLADTNFSKWRVASDIGEAEIRQHLLDLRESSNDAATEEDLLAEILLKLGYSLSEQAEHVDVGGLSTWRVGAGSLMAYLNEHVKPTLDQLRELAGSKCSFLVVAEDAFQGDDELKTNLAQLCKTNNVELWTA